MPPKAVIADDEKVLREYLASLLSEVWPELAICGEAANGLEALDLAAAVQPDVLFLDIRMPGLSGLEVAKGLADGCHVVFVTAFDRFAVEAFELAAADYLLKPVSKERLQETVARLKRRLDARTSPPALSDLLARLLPPADGPHREVLRWIRAQHRDAIRLIPVADIDYFKAEDKYTLVATRDGESLIKKSIKELAEELDASAFWQIHRGTIVNVSRIEQVSHSLTGRGVVKLKGRPELLTVSRNYLHLFKQM